jgi:CDP-diacylglycerol--glycerol-3-phosphate 3-phosphatidyltransferase/archaetidylinositol phosphate synthase
MIDGLNRSWTGRLWEDVARPLARTGITPNQVTLIGLALVLSNCAAFYAHGDTLVFGVGLIFSFAFDSLDGAVARLQGTSSKLGGYLDAVIDRYQEIAVYLVIAVITGWWAVAFFAMSGSLMISYNKARTALEIPIDNHNWPDLLERFERIVIITSALILDSFVVLPDFLGGRVLYFGLLVIAVFSHITAVQRFFRARALIQRHSPRDQ